MNTDTLVRETCKKYPDAGNRTLARLLTEQYPHAFTIEKARTAIRSIRGALGNRARKEVKDKSLMQPLRKPCTITIPDGVKQTLPPARIKTPGKWLVCGDLHAPYHDERAVVAMLRYAKQQKVTHLYLNGDVADFYKLSKWSQDPRFRNPDSELETIGELLKEFAKHFKGERHYKMGNHEDRYERYLYERAPALVGIRAFELDRVLDLESLGYGVVRSRQFAYLGNLPIFHGHELPRGLTDPVNVGRGVFLRVRESAAVNHWHKTSHHADTSGLKKRVTSCWSLGCLCDLVPEYAPVNSWNHGFAIVTVKDDGHYQFENKTIVDGEVYA
jgi:hypothetical protein